MEELVEKDAETAEKKKKKVSLPGGKKSRKAVKLIIIAAVAVGLVIGGTKLMGKKGGETGPAYRAEQVSRRDLTVKVSGTATLEPADSYQVTTLISGAIGSAPFEEEDLVEQGALLYTLDSGDAKSSVERAQISVEQSKLSYEQAEEALRPTAPLSGTINEVFVHNGDNVSAGAALAKIVTSTDLTIDFVFTYTDPNQFYVGQSATVFFGNFDGPVQGTVTTVSNATSVTSNGKESCTVRVKVVNPGVVSDTFTASAVIGSYSSYGTAPVSMSGAATVYASGSGTVTGFQKLSGATVTKGEALCTIESETNRTQLQNAKLSVDSARLSAGSAAGNLDDYNIQSPISGTVIEKNFKAGDKVDGASSGTLAVVYDLSCLKMKMNVNELDIGKIQVGQTVEITADALPGEAFTGVVEKVSINGTTTGGFTTYPVTVRVEDYGNLKPGMNVSADVLGETAVNVLCVPVGAVDRGNTVLVPGEGAMTEDGSAVADPTKLESRPVTLGRNDDAYIEITSGVNEGDTILILDQALDGMGG
ncbi:efflux RND transporter periplasmic adaptor subunit [Oscillibacter sp.]|uniref:efflux RND transporter periplasmic adaptor subunit n=1 Tax=Oscillibacter sp. TaxID=1945593 RepID=UPI002608DE62|nr:efflux RND transporter periplasmic adaptor subunit [Oscillibacter sp.]MDD3347735.1 efflux RND transporter periplasmic adaptor subunit [Oscillibacter sp.]